MLQRQQTELRYRHNLQKKLEQTQQQLSSDFYQLTQLRDEVRKNRINQVQCSNILQQMLQKMTYPIIGVQILRDKFLQMNLFENTGFSPFEMIQSKAQTIYIESIMGDLKKMQNQQPIDSFQSSKVKDIIGEINWKIGMEKSIHQSRVEEVGQHVDLMKFFEGVRNYQNWNENVKKETIDKLKNKAYDIQLKLTLKKGFILSKLQKITHTFEQNNQKLFLSKCNFISKMHNLQKFTKAVQRSKVRLSFDLIYQESQVTKDSQKIAVMLENYWTTKVGSIIQKEVLKFLKASYKIKLFVSKVQKVLRQKEKASYSKMLQKINFKKKTYIGGTLLGLEKLRILAQRKLKSVGLKVFNVPYLHFLKVLNKCVIYVLNDAFKEIKNESDSNKVTKTQLSLKMKGKVLDSLPTPQERPVDIKQAFLNWYIKGNQNKLAKKVYNIWLTGSTSKFTFFMRMKNLIDQNRNYKIKYELKLFLMVFNEKMNKYYNHGQKSILQKWAANTRRIKKIQKMFETISHVEKQTNEVLRKNGWQKILHVFKDSLTIQKFCFKYLGNFVANIKTGVNIWKMLPDVKRSKGQIMMRKILRNIVDQIVATKKSSFIAFKSNKIQGHDKKVKVLRKAFNLDFIYLQKYYQLWRMKKNDLIKKDNQFQSRKGKLILLMQKYHDVQYEKNIKDIIKKFQKKKSQQKIRQTTIKKVFINILKRSQNESFSNVYMIFKNDWQEGVTKKNNLVKWLVNANKTKQSLTLQLIKNKSTEMHNLEKILRTEKLFAIAESSLRESITIFDKSQFIFAFLNKILTNRARNFHSVFKNIQALPKRMNWKKRDNGIKLYETLMYFYKRNKGYSLSRYKENLLTGRFKMTKSMDIMAAKYFDVTRKYFNTYRKNVNRIKMDQLNKNLGGNFETMDEVLRNNFRTFFIGEALWKKRADNITKLNQRVKVRIGQAFKLWRETSKSMAYYEKILNEKKTRYIEILTKSLGRSQFSEAKRAISLFRKNQKVTDVQLTFLRRLCDSQAGKVVKAVMIWKGLPEPKNKEKISRATKFESLMSKIAMRNYKKTFSIFKQDQYTGNERKKYCIRQLVAKSCSGMKSYFEKWRQNNKLSIIFGRCEAISHLIHINQGVAQNNFKFLFEGKEASVKRQKLHGLQVIMCRQKKELLSLWRQKMIYLRNFDNKKAQLLIKLAQINKSTQTKNVRDYVIKKFTQLRVKQIIDKERRKQCKLLEILDNSMKRRKMNIAESFDVFKFNMYKGNFKKKKAFENWLRDKISQINGYLGGWNELAKQAVMTDKRKIISHNFQQMDTIVRANLSHLISNRRQMQLKRKTLNNLFKTQQLRLKGTITMWHSNIKQLKILGELDKQAKSSILQRINKIVNIGSEQNIKKAIQKFHNSMKIQAIQKKFINQLLKTKSGLLLGALGKWKSIPAINLGERYKKGQKFFNKLQSLQRSRKSQIYQEFKKDYEQANRVKKYSILQLFDMTSTGIRRFYRRWQKLTKERLTLRSVQELMKSMQIMDGAVSNQFQIIFQDQRAYTIKVNAINRLIEASQGTLGNFFNVWRSNTKQLKIQQSMDNEKKTLALAMFTKALDGSEKNMVINTIRKFKLNTTVTDISKKFFNRLLQTKTGKIMFFMEKLKSIPDAKVAVRKKKAIKFESSLNKFAMKVMKTAFDPFKSCNYIAIDRKKYCINKLIRKSMGQQYRSFTRWRNVVQEGKVLEHSHFAQKFFSNMQSILTDTMMPMFMDSKEQVQKKKNLCRKLVMNSQFVQHHAFMIWKEAQREDDLKIVKRQSKVKDVLKNFINVFSHHEKKNAITGFAPFRKFLVLDKIEKFSQMQKKTHTKAYKFYDIIEKFKNSRLNLLIESCKNSAIEMTFANKISALETMFKNSNQVYAQNLMMLMRNERQTIIIQNALNRIFSNFKVGTQKAFNLWRDNARVLKLQNMMGNEKKKNILDIMNKFLCNSEFVGIKRSIELFQKNYKQTKIQKQILMKIINAKAGCVPIMFMKWKALPSQTGKKYKMKAMKFENALFRAWSLRMKTTYQSFKDQSYDATVKKKFAIRKLISVTMSDSNRVFNKWRKVNNETKITQKMITTDKVFSFSQNIFLRNIQILNQFKQENISKINALNQIFIVQQNYLKDSLKKWIEENKNYKIQKITHALKKYTQEEMNKRFIKQSFNQIKQRFEVQTMKGYINSLWKWKMTNTQSQYYEKFIKIFSQSEELLILSKLLNKKQGDSLHFAMTQIKMTSNERFNRKVHLVEKYLSKKVKVYFERMRANIYREQVSTWKGKYGQVVKTQKFTNIISKVTRKEQNDAFAILKKNETYLQKVEKLASKIESFKTKNVEASFKNVYRYGFYKIIKVFSDTRNKIKEHMYLESFNNIIEAGKLRHLNSKFDNVTKSSMVRRAFQYLKKNSDRLTKQKLALLLIAGQLTRQRHENKVKVIQSFQKRRIKCICLNKISQTINRKVQDLERIFFHIDQNDVKIVKLLQLFKRGTAIKNIVQKQDKKLLKGYFDRLKKKENKWIGEAIRKFATRSSIRSSVAVSLWRLKTYAQH